MPMPMSVFRLPARLVAGGLFLPLLAGCATFWNGSSTTTAADQGQGARADLEATRVDTCEPSGVNWDLEGEVRSVEVVRTGGRWILVYESMMRNGPRTVWQPLSESLRVEGDGIVVGQKNLPLIADFRVTRDAQGNMWTTYRAKARGSELYASFVEMLPAKSGSALQRVRLPTGARESVQEVWLLPTSKSGVASVVVRVNPYAESGDEVTLFRWYAVDLDKGRVRAAGEYRTNSEVLSSTRFLPLGKTHEPVAFSVTSRSQDFEAADPKFQRATFRIVAKRIFARSREEVVLHESPAPLANLTIEATPALKGIALMGWIQEPTGGANTRVQWASFRFDGTDAALPALRKAPKIIPKGIEVKHDPARLRMRLLPSGVWALHWWTANDEDAGYLVTPIHPQPAEILMESGRDSTGQPRRESRPLTSGSYASERNARIMGVAAGAGPQGADLIIMSQPAAPGGKSIESGTTLSSCVVKRG